MTRFLLHSFPVPRAVAPLATVAEEDGWDGLVLADSQNLVGDPYSELALAASATAQLELGPFVTNPVTRHAAVTASAIATLQAESGGRAVLGIGRGDSSLAAIGIPRASLDHFGRYLDELQGYLSGRAVDVDGRASRLQWLSETGQPKVPVDVVATGPRSIATAATHADRVTFAVGASTERIASAMEMASAARALAGRAPGSLRMGACVVAATAPDAAEARDLVRANVGILARFVGQAAADDAGGQSDRATERAVAEAYDEARHGLGSAVQSTLLPDRFVDHFAVVGTPALCTRRLDELVELGLHHVVIVGPSRDIDRRRAEAAIRRFALDVLPGTSARG